MVINPSSLKEIRKIAVDRSGVCSLCRKLYPVMPRDGICQTCDEAAVLQEKELKKPPQNNRKCRICRKKINNLNYFFCSSCHHNLD